MIAPLLLYAQLVFKPPVKIGVAGEGKVRGVTAPIPFPAENERWLRIVTPRFDIVSAAADYRTRDVARDLETLATALHELQPDSHAAAPRTRVVIFGRRRDAQPYFDTLMEREKAKVGGLFVGRNERGVMLIDGSSSIEDRTPYHELIHSLLADRGPRPPLWVEEGLAEFYSNAEFGRGEITFGFPIREHVNQIHSQPLVPIRAVFATRYESEGALNTIFYAESWAAVDSLIALNRREFPAFVADLIAGIDVEKALRTHYRRTIDDMMNAVAMYAGFNHPIVTFRVAAPPPHDVEPPRLLSRPDVLQHLGSVLAIVPGLESEAERHFRAALAIDPKYVRALTSIGALRLAEKEFAEADRIYKQASEIAPNDPEVLLDRAESLLRNELGPFAETNEIGREDVARFHEARALAQEALAKGAEAGRACGVIGTSYIRDADVTPGIAALQKAHTLLPSRADYALHLFAMLRQTEQMAKADALFADLDSMHDPEVAFAARAVILRLEIDRANTLIKQQRLSDAAAVLRALVDQTDDRESKSSLARQASEIEYLVGINAQVSAYNDAVSLFNHHRLKETIAALDTLLATATDPKVIADATRLREQALKHSKR
ncbi:MAG TPA: tetratricopeptide repeat protein [Thermoanaerobaculia bacterium]